MSADQPKESALRDASDARKATALERIEAVIAWIERGELLPGPGVGPDLEDWKTIAAALATLPGQTSALRDDQVREAGTDEITNLRRIAWLIGSIYCFGNFKAETINERELEARLRVNGTFWTTQAEFDRALAATRPAEPAEPDLQARVQPWMLACFGAEIASDKRERNHRFLEEALELVQATGCTEDEARQLVAYVYSRPAGEPDQEVGGVMITLAALCLAQGLDMHSAGERELARIWTCVEKIRAKQAAKPRHSPLAEQARSASTLPLAETAKALVERIRSLAHEMSRQDVDAAVATETPTRKSLDFAKDTSRRFEAAIEALAQHAYAEGRKDEAEAAALRPSAAPEPAPAIEPAEFWLVGHSDMGGPMHWQVEWTEQAARLVGQRWAKEATRVEVIPAVRAGAVPTPAEPVLFDERQATAWVANCPHCERAVHFVRPSAALAASPDSSVHPAGLAPAPSSTVRAKGGA